MLTFKPTIGIIGYGMVGKAVQHGFDKIGNIIVDPQYNTRTIEELCEHNPIAIFVCVPTPTDDTNYSILKETLQKISATGYNGITVVKSTILPHHLEGFDVVYNPEFLSRATSFNDFVNPPFVLLGGDLNKTQKLADIYRQYSQVNMDCVKFTDIKTASLAKYTFNTFYATKLTFMNEIYDVASKVGVDYDNLRDVLKLNPWMMGVSHLDVPGSDGQRGFGGPCLPKDTEALAREYNVEILQKVLEINHKYRNENTYRSIE
jgi:UDPglucose 6-dehydrogenase